jgi:hypothetical protein
VKKWTLMGALALSIAAVSGQQASAWYKVGFSAGVNFTWESGNNSYLWGAWRSGNIPGHPTDLPTWVSHYPQSNSAIAGGGGFGGGFGGDFSGMNGGIPYGHGAPNGGDPGYTGPQPQSKEPPMDKKGGDNNGGNGNNGSVSRPASASTGYNGYQPVGYQYQAPNYSYQAPAYSGYNYGYGYGSYGYSQVPSYWYGY